MAECVDEQMCEEGVAAIGELGDQGRDFLGQNLLLSLSIVLGCGGIAEVMISLGRRRSV